MRLWPQSRRVALTGILGYAEHTGASLGCIVDAAAKEAMATAFCLSTDATGVAIQPTRLADGQRQPCAKGHFFVVLADKDHVFFEYQPKHTSDAVCSIFRGFKGYIQADAHAVYDALFRGEAVEKGEKPPDEVACWSHYPDSPIIWSAREFADESTEMTSFGSG